MDHWDRDDAFYIGLIIAVILSFTGLFLFCSRSAKADITAEKEGDGAVTINIDGQDYDILPMQCPINGGWQFKGPLEEFETLCDCEGCIDFLDDGIRVDAFCPFRAKIKDVPKHSWVGSTCDIFLKYHQKDKRDQA